MKKIYLIAAFLGMASMALSQEKLSQKTIQSLSKKAKIQHSVEMLPVGYSSDTNVDKPINDNVNAKSGEYFVGDFSDPDQWILDPNPLGAVNWEFKNNTDFPGYDLGGGQLIIPPVTTDPTEIFAVFDLIPALQEPVFADQGGWIQIGDTFDFTSVGLVALSFDQVYTGLNFDETFIQYSSDNGATWNDFEVNGGSSANVTYTTSEYIVLNTGNSSQFLIRFYYECKRVPTSAEGAQGGYVWQIHNVLVSEVNDNDISVATPLLAGFGPGTLSEYNVPYSDDPSYYGIGEDLFRYTQIPLSQVQEVNSMIRIENMGKLDQTDVKLGASEASAGYSSASSPITLPVGDIEVIMVEDGFAPTTTGNYTIEYEITADATDEVPVNNQIAPYEFTVGEYTYAYDNAGDAAKDPTPLNNSWGAIAPEGSSPGIPIEIGAIYEIVETTELSAIEFKFGFNDPTEGSEVWGVIYKDGEKAMDQLPPTYFDETEHYFVGSQDAGKYISLQFDGGPITLTPGKYMVTVKSYDTDFSVGSAGPSTLFNTFIFGALAESTTDELWFPLGESGAPVVRMNFEPTLSIASNKMSELNVTQYPNPFANETTVKFSLEDASNVSYTIVDVTGKVIATADKGQLMAGDHEFNIDGTSFANGIYYLNLKADNASVTHRLVVNK